MSTTKPVLVKEVQIAASPETVFPFLIDSSLMAKWFGEKADLDPTPGGKFSVDIRNEHFARGEYTEIVPNERVAFTFGWEGNELVGPGSTTVVITLTAKDNGTELRLEHYDLPNDEMRGKHLEGWTNHLGQLVEAAAN